MVLSSNASYFVSSSLAGQDRHDFQLIRHGMRVQCSMFHSLGGTTAGLYIDMEGALHVWLLSASAELSLYLDICFGTKGCYGPHRPIVDISKLRKKCTGYHMSRVNHAGRTPESSVR